VANAFSSPWSPQDDERLKTLVVEGATAKEAAVAVGRSRSAVLGRIYRLGLSARRSRAPRAKKAVEPMAELLPAEADASRAAPDGRRRLRRSETLDPPAAPATLAAIGSDATPCPSIVSEPAPVAYLDLRFGRCRRLLDARDGDGLPFSCGAPTKPGSSWCPACFKRMFCGATEARG